MVRYKRLVSFFFSSRRRNTRLRRDWSSDVCSSDLPLTALGQAELDAWVVTDNPWFRCISKTPPWLFSGVGAHRFVRDGDAVVIRHEINDVERVIHLGLTAHPADTEPSHLAHSIARLEGATRVAAPAYLERAHRGNGSGR